MRDKLEQKGGALHRHRRDLDESAADLEAMESYQAPPRSSQARINAFSDDVKRAQSAPAEPGFDLATTWADNRTAADEISQLKEAVEEQKASVAERFSELAILTRMLIERNKELELHQSLIRRLEARLAELTDGRAWDRQRCSFIANVCEAHLEAFRNRLSWRVTAPLRAVANIMGRKRAIRRLIERSSLFDRHWYLATYSDVADAGIDPLEHYLHYGAKEGRDPSPAFSSRAYLQKNADVAEAGVNPLVHFVLHGCFEGRIWRS